MGPEELLAAVTARTPVDEREAASIGRFHEELRRLERPYDEHADPVHVTGSAIIVSDRGIVLHLHKRMGLWLQPGGHVDEGETPADAALREATEETGLALRHPADGPRLVHVDVHPGPRGHTHLDVRYLLESRGEEPNPPEGESQQVAWFDWEQAAAVADAGLSGAIEALRPPR